MRRLMALTTLFTLPFFGCDNVETALKITRVLAPSGQNCEYSPSNDTQLAVRFDAAGNHLFVMVLGVENKLQTNTIELAEGEEFTPANDVTPLRFDLRWECDSNGFSAELGPLYLPQFSVDRPFCLDKRDDTTGSFVGFDVVNAGGGPVPAGGESSIEIRPITPQMAGALDTMFEIAVEADRCCAGDCKAITQIEPSAFSDPSCKRVRDLFNAVGGGDLSTTNLADIEKFRPFATFDGDYFDTINPTFSCPMGSTCRTPAYPIRLRGILEGMTSDGSLVTSTEYAESINICRDCGGTTPCMDF